MKTNDKNKAVAKPYFSSSTDKKKVTTVPNELLNIHMLQTKASQIERTYPSGYQGL